MVFTGTPSAEKTLIRLRFMSYTWNLPGRIERQRKTLKHFPGSLPFAPEGRQVLAVGIELFDAKPTGIEHVEMAGVIDRHAPRGEEKVVLVVDVTADHQV